MSKSKQHPERPPKPDEGAVGAAIRILREQRTEIERLKRSMGLVQRADESHEAFKARVAVTNDKFDMRACMARSE